MTLGAESSWSGSYVTTIIQNFTLVSLTSTTMPHRVKLSFGASGLLPDLRTRLLLTLRIQPLTVYATELAGHLCGIIRSDIIRRSSTCQGMRLDHLWTLLSGKKWLVGWTQQDLLPYTVVSLVISIGQGVLTRSRKLDTSKARLDGSSLWELLKTTRPDVCIRLELFWNDWELGRVGLPWSPR